MKNPNPKIKNNSDFKKQFNRRLINFSLEVIKLCKTLRKDRNLWPLTDQIMKSATSVGANVIEAKGSGSKKDYIKFFQIALKSANETKYWLLLIRESSPKFRTLVQKLLSEINELSKIIGAGILTMKGKR